MKGFALILWLLSMVVVDASAAPAEAPPKELRLGYFPNITHAQALWGRATGEFEKTIGVPVAWTAFNAGPTAIEALFANAIDAAFIGPGPTINGYIKSKGEKFVIVAGSASGGAGLVVRGDSGIAGEKDFNGKTIATPQLGNTQDVAARVWFAEKGYRLREQGGTLALLPLSNPDQLTMFQKRQIDGAWTIEPWLSRLEAEAGGRLLLDEKTLWPDGRYVTTHLVVSRAFLAEHPEIVEKLLAALIDATQRINADKEAAARLLNAQLQKETGKALRPEVIRSAMARVEFTWDPIGASLKKSAGALHRVGFVKAAPAINDIYALGPLNALLKARGLPPVQGLTPSRS